MQQNPSGMVVDFHSHILPGIDDGSRCVSESLAMLRMHGEQGIREVVATPHFYPDRDTPDRFLKRREAARIQLQQAMEGDVGLPKVVMGAEVSFFSGISETELLFELTIEGKKCILLEMPPAPWTPSMYREIEAISMKQGITPVIAHVDRYIRPLKTYQIPERLAQLPVMVQANASFFLRNSTSRMAMRLLREDKIQLLGSDCHNLSSRKPNLGDAIAKIEMRLGKEVLVRMNSREAMLLGVGMNN